MNIISMKARAAAAIAVLVMGVGTAYAGPEGSYTVVGTDPGGTGKYRGAVNVVASGNVYEVVWRIGKSRFTGVGILTGSGFSVAYYGSSITGVAAYREQANGVWKGEWAIKGSSQLGSEDWTPQ